MKLTYSGDDSEVISQTPEAGQNLPGCLEIGETPFPAIIKEYKYTSGDNEKIPVSNFPPKSHQNPTKTEWGGGRWVLLRDFVAKLAAHLHC